MSFLYEGVPYELKIPFGNRHDYREALRKDPNLLYEYRDVIEQLVWDSLNTGEEMEGRRISTYTKYGACHRFDHSIHKQYLLIPEPMDLPELIPGLTWANVQALTGVKDVLRHKDDGATYAIACNTVRTQKHSRTGKLYNYTVFYINC